MTEPHATPQTRCYACAAQYGLVYEAGKWRCEVHALPLDKAQWAVLKPQSKGRGAR